MKKSWIVKTEGWVLGRYRLVGDKVEATEGQAKWLVLAGNIEASKPKSIKRAGDGKRRS